MPYLVLPLRLRLLRLHLETTPDCVEGVGRVSCRNRGGLGDNELGGHTQDTLVVLVGVVGRPSVVQAEVHTTVPAFVDESQERQGGREGSESSAGLHS